jgi:hypothetical protein
MGGGEHGPSLVGIVPYNRPIGQVYTLTKNPKKNRKKKRKVWAYE